MWENSRWIIRWFFNCTHSQIGRKLGSTVTRVNCNIWNIPDHIVFLEGTSPSNKPYAITRKKSGFQCPIGKGTSYLREISKSRIFIRILFSKAWSLYNYTFPCNRVTTSKWSSGAGVDECNKLTTPDNWTSISSSTRSPLPSTSAGIGIKMAGGMENCCPHKQSRETSIGGYIYDC